MTATSRIVLTSFIAALVAGVATGWGTAYYEHRQNVSATNNLQSQINALNLAIAAKPQILDVASITAGSKAGAGLIVKSVAVPSNSSGALSNANTEIDLTGSITLPVGALETQNMDGKPRYCTPSDAAVGVGNEDLWAALPTIKGATRQSTSALCINDSALAEQVFGTTANIDWSGSVTLTNLRIFSYGNSGMSYLADLTGGGY